MKIWKVLLRRFQNSKKIILDRKEIYKTITEAGANNNGTRLIHFAIEKEITIMSSYFVRKGGHKEEELFREPRKQTR